MTAALGLVYLLIALLGTVAIVNARGTRLLQFPFLYSSVWVAFVLLALVEFMTAENNGLYEAYEAAGVVDTVLFVIFTSALGGLLGHALAGGSRPRRHHPQTPSTLDERQMRRMHKASCVIAALSYLAFLYLATLGGGLKAYLFESGNYVLTWEGLPVYLIFVVRFGYVSIVIQLWLWTRTGRNKHLVYSLIFSIIPFLNIFLIFRRSELVAMGIYYGYFLLNYTRFNVGRLQALLAIGAMFAAFKIFPLLRNEEGKQMSLKELIDTAFAPRETFDNSEIASGFLRIHHSMTHDVYEYGAIFWNAFVKQFVPSGLVGADFKSSLMILQIQNMDSSFANFRFYLSPMGFAQAYQQIWLFAGLLFVVLGYCVAKLEQRRFMGARQEIFLVLMLPPLLSTISADLSLIVSRAVTFSVLVVLCIPRSPLPPQRAANACRPTPLEQKH